MVTKSLDELRRVLSNLDRTTNRLEAAGLLTQSDALDAAGAKIEDVMEVLQNLR